MAEIRPFRGIIYNQEKIKDLAKVLAPPYDVISPPQQQFYYKSHPYNIIRLILGFDLPQDNEKENKYTRARRFFRQWLSKEILKKEKDPAIYVYEKEYSLKGRDGRRKGFLALMKLEKFGTGVIFPHEQTFPKPGTDRLRLLESCRANFNPIFCLYSDSPHLIDQYLKEKEAMIELRDSDGVKHVVGRIRNEDTIRKICKAMEDKKIFLADGHHRYLTALKFRDAEKNRFTSIQRSEDFVLIYFLNMETDAITILPVHRVIGALTPDQVSKLRSKIPDFFQVEELKFNSNTEKVQRKEMFERIDRTQDSTTFGMYCGGNSYHVLRLKDRQRFLAEKINTAVLDTILRKILKRNQLEKGREIDFIKDETETAELIRAGKYQVAFFLKSLSLKEVRETSLAGKILPPKSTYFYPKPLSGLVMRDLEDGIYSL
ncbi:MAG: DUF1015 domain-containing protein [bacterium]